MIEHVMVTNRADSSKVYFGNLMQMFYETRKGVIFVVKLDSGFIAGFEESLFSCQVIDEEDFDDIPF